MQRDRHCSLHYAFAEKDSIINMNGAVVHRCEIARNSHLSQFGFWWTTFSSSLIVSSSEKILFFACENRNKFLSLSLSCTRKHHQSVLSFIHNIRMICRACVGCQTHIHIHHNPTRIASTMWTLRLYLFTQSKMSRVIKLISKQRATANRVNYETKRHSFSFHFLSSNLVRIPHLLLRRRQIWMNSFCFWFSSAAAAAVDACFLIIYFC